MTADEIIEKTIKPIAKNGFSDALEILQLIALLKAQNSNNVNKALSKIGAGRAAMATRNAFIAQLTLLVARTYAKSRDGDLHVRRAFELIAKDPRISEGLAKRGLAGKLKDAQAMWSLCRDDSRLVRIQHFRNKYTAHIAEPDAEIPLPKYDELFPFAIETTKVMQALANASGVNNDNLPDWNDELTGTAEAFWKPWASDAPK
jgi:hypothetical protein